MHFPILVIALAEMLCECVSVFGTDAIENLHEKKNVKKINKLTWDVGTKFEWSGENAVGILIFEFFGNHKLNFKCEWLLTTRETIWKSAVAIE